jgi:porin
MAGAWRTADGKPGRRKTLPFRRHKTDGSACAGEFPMPTKSARHYLILAAALVSLGNAGNACAASNDGLFGDWGGLRTSWLDKGIDVQATYQSEIAWNPSGGKDQGTRYAEQWMLAASFDLGQLADDPGGKLYVSVNKRDGRNLTADRIGNQVQVQEIYGDAQTFRLSDLWYQQTLADGHVEFRLGRVHPGDDFAYFACDFQNLGFCARPYALLADSGWTDMPASVWGGRIKFMAGPWYVEGGAYQVNPRYLLAGQGFKLDFAGTTGVLVPLEVGVLPKSGAQQLPGNYKIGAYYDSSDAPDLYEDSNAHPAALTGLSARVRAGRYGSYVMALQQISARSPGSKEGISLFGYATLADRNTALIRSSMALGILALGPFASRPKDQVELAIGRFQFNHRLSDYQRLLNGAGAGPVGVQGAETDITLQYNAQVITWCTLGPNVQYVIHPDGLHAIANAFVVGLLAKVTF